MIDAELLRRKMALILGDLQVLEPLAEKTLEEYLVSPLDELVAERVLQRIVGRLIDINYHVVTESGHPPPRDYYQSFHLMGRLGVLPGSFARRIAAAAGLRNRLVHDYDEIDPAKVYQALAIALIDVREYLGHVEAHLDTIERQGSEPDS